MSLKFQGTLKEITPWVLDFVEASLDVPVSERMGLFLWGPPGIGKSDWVRDFQPLYRDLLIRKEMLQPESLSNNNKPIFPQVGFIDTRLASLEASDASGIPYPSEDKTRAVWLRPEFFPDEQRDGKFGIHFLDEFANAHPSVQNSMYGYILNGLIAVSGIRKPHGWMSFAASNRVTDRGRTFALPGPLANRFVHIEVVASYDAWREWAINHKVHPLVIGYLGHMSSHLAPEIKDLEDLRAFPTPRTWVMVSKLLWLKSNKNGDISNEDLARLEGLIHGSVGSSAATTFIAFSRISNELVDPIRVLEGEDVKFEGMHEGGKGLQAAHALITACIYRIQTQTDQEKFKKWTLNFGRYVTKLPIDLCARAMTDLFMNSKTFSVISKDNGPILEWGYNNHDKVQAIADKIKDIK